jgi:hypothetical protein
LASYLKPTWEINIGSEMDRKSEINEREAEELIKGMGRIATVVVHDNGVVTATAISAIPSDTRIQK